MRAANGVIDNRLSLIENIELIDLPTFGNSKDQEEAKVWKGQRFLDCQG